MVESLCKVQAKARNSDAIQAYLSSYLATFKIEGVDYSLRLDCFTSYQIVSEMLDSAFDQGKRFAAQAMRRHITMAMDQAERDHAL